MECAHDDDFAGADPRDAESAISAKTVMKNYADPDESDPPAPLIKNNSDFVRLTRSKVRNTPGILLKGL